MLLSQLKCQLHCHTAPQWSQFQNVKERRWVSSLLWWMLSINFALRRYHMYHIWYNVHCKNGIVNITTKHSDAHYYHYMVVIIKLSDVHCNDSDHHYFEQGWKVVIKFVVLSSANVVMITILNVVILEFSLHV